MAGSPIRAALVAVAITLFLAIASPAQAFIYWGEYNNTGGSIGRAKPDGTSVQHKFIPNAVTCGIAVDSAHIYWTTDANGTPGAGKIGRANLNGSPASIRRNFIAGASNPCGIAVDGAHIYWTNNAPAPDGSVGRADLDGNPASVKQNFIGGLNYACGVAVDASHIYWANRDAGTIGRANLNGGARQPNFINVGASICGIAIDSTHIYWSESANPGNRIGRASIDGNPASVKPDFITGLDHACGVAVDKAHIFWATAGQNQTTVGRANLDGQGIKNDLVTGSPACFVAADRARPADTSPPTITIRVPAAGASYTQGKRVIADYSCSDPDGPADVKSCTGPVPDGQPINTSSAGQHTFAVHATDRAGNPAVKTVHYSVKAKPAGDHDWHTAR